MRNTRLLLIAAFMLTALIGSAKCFDGPSYQFYKVYPGEGEVLCPNLGGIGTHTLYMEPGTHFRIQIYYGDCPPMMYSIEKDGVLLDTNSTFMPVEYMITTIGEYTFEAYDSGWGGLPIDLVLNIIDDPT